MYINNKVFKFTHSILYYSAMDPPKTTNSVQANNTRILNDIQKLQSIEQSIFSKLESSTLTLSPEQQINMIEKINSISNMRINLYRTLNGLNSHYKETMNNTESILQNQETSVRIAENELNRAKTQLDSLESQRINKLRMVQINDYYGKQYEEHTQFMKILIYMLLPIIGFLMLKNAGILPEKIYYGLVIIVATIGSYFLSKVFYSIVSRSSMNYDEYKWNFNANKVVTDGDSTDAQTSDNDPWKLPTIGSCYGAACCSDGQYYDTTTRVCKIDENYKSDIETFASEIQNNPAIYSKTFTQPDVILT